MASQTRLKPIVLVCLSVVVAFTATTARSEDENAFSPSFSDFSVTFSGKPTIEEFETVTPDGESIKGLRAEFRGADGFQRVEVTAMPTGFSLGETKESAILKAKAYALHNGLHAPEFRWEVTSIGKRLSMRATKILDDNGQPRAVTFETVVCYGNSSLFTVYVGGLSESYPPPRLIKFLKSIKTNERR